MFISSRNGYAESHIVIPEQTLHVITDQKSITIIHLTCFYVLILKYKFHAIYNIQATKNQVRFPLTEMAKDRITECVKLEDDPVEALQIQIQSRISEIQIGRRNG